MSIWLVGAGYMAQEYAKVLEQLVSNYQVIGRGKKSALKFETITGHNVIQGGLTLALEKLKLPKLAIVAVGVEELSKVTGGLNLPSDFKLPF